ncbi:MAG: TCP-1/cpn60 chaperonin family protein, partial [Candidatus Caldarchaeum sp.]
MMLRETILKKGSQEVKAKDSVTRNIATVCKTIGLMFSRCIGPNGMNILISDEKGDTFYAHDAFTALSAIRNTMSHPIARLIHEAVKSIDDNVGDGGKTFCILLGEAFKHAEKLREAGVRTANIISGYSEAAGRCLQVLENATVRNVESAIPKLVETVLSRLPLSSDERKALSTLVLEA